MKHSNVVLAVLCALFSLPAWAAAGKFQFVSGVVRVTNASGERPAAKGLEVEEGDRITSGSPAMAQIRMSDGGVIVIRPNTRLVIQAFRFSGREDGSERAHFVLEKGSVRAVTGTIGKTNKQNYLIQTPSASIGVRGTDHEPFVIEAGDPLGASGTYDKVNVGATIVENANGSVVVPAGSVGYAANLATAPVLLPELPEFYKASSVNVQVAKRASQASRRSGGGSNSGGAVGESSASVAQPLTAADGTNLSAPPLIRQPQPDPQRSAAVASYVSIDSGDTVRSVKAPLTFDVSNARLVDAAVTQQPFGIDWGRWTGLVDAANGQVRNLHFATAPDAQLTTQAQLAQLKLGVEALYTLQGGSKPTNQLGLAGTLNKLEIGVDFAKSQITRYNLELTMPSVTSGGPTSKWRANGDGPLGDFLSGNTGIVLRVQCHNCLPNSVGVGPGSAKGAFVGPNASHLLTGYTLQVRDFGVSGAAALKR